MKRWCKASAKQEKAEERWGAGVVEQVSLDLKREFPDAQGFSTSNLWFMKRWYSFYTDNVNPKILQQFADNVQRLNKQVVPQLYQVGKEIQEKKYIVGERKVMKPALHDRWCKSERR